jgi:hypothetical protein
MASCTYDMPRLACSVALETYHGASTIILRILDRLLWIIDILDLLAQPHNSIPYVQIGMINVWTFCHWNQLQHRIFLFPKTNKQKQTPWPEWSWFLATDPEVPGSFSGATSFYEK